MTDLIIVVIMVIICGAAARDIYKAKKSGAKCIGCAVGEGGCCCSHDGAEASDGGCGSGTSSCCCCHTDTK